MNKLAIKLYRKHFPVGPNPITHGIEPSPSSFNWNTKSIFGFFDRNVYDKVLLEFVRLLPYNSTEDFLQRRMDRKKYPFLFLVALSLLLNIIRLFLMVVTSTPNMYWFLTGFFNGLNGNRREWILVITNIFLTGFTVSKFSGLLDLFPCLIEQFSECALVWVDLKPRFLYCFELLFKLSAITKRSKKTDHIVRLEKLVNIYWTINLWLRLSLVVFVIGFSIYEPIRGFYGQVDFFFLIRLLLWTATMHSGVYFSCTIGIALSAMFLSVIHYHNMQYKQFCRLFNWKLTLWISVPSKLEIIRLLSDYYLIYFPTPREQENRSRHSSFVETIPNSQSIDMESFERILSVFVPHLLHDDDYSRWHATDSDRFTNRATD